jgi:hypothetical protein
VGADPYRFSLLFSLFSLLSSLFSLHFYLSQTKTAPDGKPSGAIYI